MVQLSPPREVASARKLLSPTVGQGVALKYLSVIFAKLVSYMERISYTVARRGTGEGDELGVRALTRRIGRICRFQVPHYHSAEDVQTYLRDKTNGDAANTPFCERRVHRTSVSLRVSSPRGAYTHA